MTTGPRSWEAGSSVVDYGPILHRRNQFKKDKSRLPKVSHLVLGKQGGLVPGVRRRRGVVGVAVQGPSSHPGHLHEGFALLCQKAAICCWTLAR